MSGRKFLKEWQVTDKNYWVEFFSNLHSTLLQMTQTQEIINCRVSKIYKSDMRGCVWVGQSLLRNDKWEIKLLSWIVFQFTFNLLWMTQTQKIITCRILKIHKWIWGDVYE